MANAWRIAGVTLVMTFLGWFLSPIAGKVVNYILSYLGFEASGKLRDLKIHIIQILPSMLRKAVEQKMTKAPENTNSDVVALDELAKELRSALYEAEDILDLVDYHRLEKEVRGDSSWLRRSLQYLKDAAGSCIARCNISCFGRYVRNARRRLAALLRWIHSLYTVTATSIAGCYPRSYPTHRLLVQLRPLVQFIRNRDTLRTSTAILPISRPRSDSSVQRLRCCSRIIFKNLCRSISNWSAKAIKGARSFRSWFHEKEDVIAEDSCLPTIARMSLSKRIERLANNVIKLQESHLLKQESSSPASNNTANVNRRSITATVAREVFGRDNERDKITKMLREGTDDSSTTGDCSTSACYSVIGLYGIAGSGKTTLAEYVRDYEKEAKYFDPIMCVHVSETFRVDDIFRDMLEEITQDRHSDITGARALKAKLMEKLRGRRFLLVLDDLWVKDENYQEREELLSPLNAGSRGSKILVTARTEKAVRALGAKKPIAIPDLDKDQYFKLFMHHADMNDPKYEHVGSKIAEKLCRSPIAAVTVAARLRGITDINKWERTAKLDQSNGAMGALWWSYQQLDADVRRCFEYCSIFPRRYKLERDELVRMWIAQGFVETNNARDDMEDVGHWYCDELLSCSFLQLRITPFGTECFTIHDLLRDLAEKVAGSDCFRIENGWAGEVPRDVRHLFVTTCNRALLAEKILKLENLRTLIIGRGAMIDEIEDKDFEIMLTRLRKLRILSVPFGRESEQLSVPASICQLKHIRYLAIKTGFPLELILPSTFTKLYHMQVLDFGFSLFYPGQDIMTNLVNLRHILAGELPDLPNIYRLTSLQTLPVFRVRKEPGYELRQLRDLNKLRGRLMIDGLHNVGSKEEALGANLAGKERITELHLKWDRNSWQKYFRSFAENLQAEILQGLCPPMGIAKLQLQNYEGSRYPDWMVGNMNGQKHLQELVLCNCTRLGAIPDRNEFFLHLHCLILWGCNWEALPDNMEHLTSLKELIILGCRNIRSLPTLPKSLEYLRIVACNDVFTRSCKTIGDPNWQKIEHIPKKNFQ